MKREIMNTSYSTIMLKYNLIIILMKETVAKRWPQTWVEVPITNEFRNLLANALKHHLPTLN